MRGVKQSNTLVTGIQPTQFAGTMIRSLLITVLALVWASSDAFAQNGASAGLLAKASDGTRSITFVSPTANATLAASESIHPQLRPEFEIEWSGSLKILRSGQYTLFADAGVRIFLDDREAQSQPVQLEAGERPLRIQYRRPPGPARIRIEWQSPFFQREPIPANLLGHAGRTPEIATTALAEQGRGLIEELNCVACHRTDSSFVRGRSGPDLSNVGDRATAAWIYRWLENPRALRATASMPALGTNNQDRADIAAYLGNLKSAQASAPTAAGNAEAGASLFAKIGCAACHSSNGVTLEGLGSKFSLAGLASYLMNPLAVDPTGRMPDLGLNPTEAQNLAAHLVRSKLPDFSAPPGDAQRGRSLVSSSGCLNCHSVKDGQGQLTGTLTASSMAGLDSSRGCLAEVPSAAAAKYQLGRDERSALTAYIRSPDVSPAPVQDFQRTISALSCNLCHEWNGPAKHPAEVTPPSLTQAGDKLRASWLTKVLVEKKRVRPWMDLRMPHFGSAAEPLVPLFAAQAGAEPGEGSSVSAPSREEVIAGAKILGTATGGLGCVNCHDFLGTKSMGTLRGPDLTEIHDRVRTDWLRRWLWEPSRLQPGTAMPAFFSDVSPAKAAETIEVIVRTLAAGKQLPRPPGLDDNPQSFIQKVGADPVLYRVSMQEIPRAIAVGLPGGQSYCFDAQSCQLRYAWSGAFLDMKLVWTGQGGGAAEPLGRRWFTAPAGIFPLRLGGGEANPKEVRFKGYRLEQGVPVMLYQVDGVSVAEKITATPDGKGLLREFTLGSAPAGVAFMSSAPADLKIESSAGPATGGRFTIPGGPAPHFTVTISTR